MAKKSKLLEKLKELLAIEEDNFDNEEEEEEYEEDPHEQSLVIRMTLAYNLLVEASETMPISYSKEFQFKRDKERARILYNRCCELATQYHNFLFRIKDKVK